MSEEHLLVAAHLTEKPRVAGDKILTDDGVDRQFTSAEKSRRLFLVPVVIEDRAIGHEVEGVRRELEALGDPGHVHVEDDAVAGRLARHDRLVGHVVVAVPQLGLDEVRADVEGVVADAHDVRLDRLGRLDDGVVDCRLVAVGAGLVRLHWPGLVAGGQDDERNENGHQDRTHVCLHVACWLESAG